MAHATSSQDLVVLGGTPGGIAAAVRAARAALDATLVTYNAHLGGMMAGGLSRTDSFIGTQARSPLLEEFFERVATHYRETYGPGSSQYETCEDGFLFEPHVAEMVFDDLVAEAGVTVHREYHATGVERDGRELRSLTVESFGDGETLELAAETFVDGTYEGDLAAVAGVPYRLGRESRAEFGEQYAGRLFSEKQTPIRPGSTGVGDDAVQSYDYRLCLTDDPDNMQEIPQPPNYDREEFLPLVEDPIEVEEGAEPWESREIPCHLKGELVRLSREEVIEQGFAKITFLRGPLPNDKYDLNTADLPGEADDYPEGDWETREAIARRHREHVLGLLYFFQHDKAVPESVQAEANQYGLPQDEFGEDGFPFQLYVREARRIEGRETFTEGDARIAEGLNRAPINGDSIAIAEYPMDSHDCRPVRRPGSLCEGHFFLPEITMPSQVPYGSLLPEDLDNLVVPVALSATHVGFGTIRLEPTWFHIGETAGYATALASERETTPGDLEPSALQRRLIDDGGMCTYFEDVDVADDAAWVPAVQYCGTLGFFDTYDARPEEPLRSDTADRWAEFTAALAAETTTDTGDTPADPTGRARSLPGPDVDRGESVTAGDYVSLLRDAFLARDLSTDRPVEALETLSIAPEESITRGAACRLSDELFGGTPTERSTTTAESD